MPGGAFAFPFFFNFSYGSGCLTRTHAPQIITRIPHIASAGVDSTIPYKPTNTPNHDKANRKYSLGVRSVESAYRSVLVILSSSAFCTGHLILQCKAMHNH